ncbi:MAG: hypothetical protein AB2448_06290 [Moorella sp. (in: firmicutes)]
MRLTPEGFAGTELDCWDIFYDAKDRGKVLSGIVTSVVTPKTLKEFYWELRFKEGDGIRGIVPASETGLPSERMMNFFIDQEVNVKIRHIDKKNGIVACTRREVVEEARTSLLNTLQAGEEVPALVRFISRRNVGLDIGGGVIIPVPYTKAAHSKSLPLEAIYKPGQLVTAVVEGIDKENKRIEVGIKDPWENADFSRGDIVSGKIIMIRGRNLFVEVRQGIVGIAGYPVGRKISEGERFPFQVLHYDKAGKKLHMVVFDPERIRGRRKLHARRREGSSGQSK